MPQVLLRKHFRDRMLHVQLAYQSYIDHTLSSLSCAIIIIIDSPIDLGFLGKSLGSVLV